LREAQIINHTINRTKGEKERKGREKGEKRENENL
jgi:hypothetical protein